MDLWKKAKKLIPGGSQLLSKRSEMFLPDQWPSYYSKAKGIEVWDLDGKKYSDMCTMGIGSCILGYADDDVNKAVKQRIDNANMTTLNCPEEIELAERLISLNKWAGKVRYARTGGESMAVAVRIARVYAKREKLAFCYDDKTEILTKNGFRRFEDLDENEVIATLNPTTNKLEYQPIQRKIKFHYSGDMVHLKGQRVDLLVTPDHNIYRKFRLTKGYRFKLEAANKALKRKSLIQMTSVCDWDGDIDIRQISIPELHGQARPTKGLTSFPVEDFSDFMGWYLSEGSCTMQERGRYEVVIAQTERHIEKSTEILSIIGRLGFKPYRNGHHICFNSKELVSYLKQFGKAKEKHIPSWVKDLPKEYLAIFADSMIKGDGTFEKGKPRKFYSTSPKLIDGMQEILLKLGYSTTISERKNNGFSKGKIYTLYVSKEKLLGCRAKKAQYDGFVYCVTVPNHIIMVRRNGKLAWSGNCGYHGWHDWYLATNLKDPNGLNDHLLKGLDPGGVPRELSGTSLPFHYNNIEELEALVDQHKDIGVIVVEAIRSKKPENDFLGKVRKIADELGAVLVFDEISSGFRSSIGGEYEKFGVRPDIVVFAKAMSNGYPMGAIVGKDAVMDAAQESFISSTYWTEGIGPTAALATINKMEGKKVPEHIVKIGEAMGRLWEELGKANDLKIHVDFGFLPIMHFDFEYGDKNLAVMTLFTQEMLSRGFLASGGFYVSYAHTKDDLQRYGEACNDVFKLIASAVKESKVEKLLRGPIKHGGFQRLTD